MTVRTREAKNVARVPNALSPETVRSIEGSFEQRVGSMEEEHHKILHAGAGEDVGVKMAEQAREHDRVYKVVASDPGSEGLEL